MFETHDFGGNSVRHIGVLPSESCVLADDAYRYEIVVLRQGTRRVIDGLSTGAAWLLRAPSGVTVDLPCGSPEHWAPGSALLFDGPGLTISADTGGAVLLLAGTSEPSGEPPQCSIQSPDHLKRVEKPWGEELWINGRHPTFAFKRIVLRAGNRTSLQYHDFKRETNLLLEGSARLHFNETPGGHDGPYASAPIESIGAIDVTPGILHRIEAVTDVTLFEVSTPHLDDVIRVSDDTARADGFIASEHAGAARP